MREQTRDQLKEEIRYRISHQTNQLVYRKLNNIRLCSCEHVVYEILQQIWTQIVSRDRWMWNETKIQIKDQMESK